MTDKFVKLMKYHGNAHCSPVLVNPAYVVALDNEHMPGGYTLCTVKLVTGEHYEVVGTYEEVAKVLGLEVQNDD
ncbi:MAG TPA: hypothetical protein VF389_11595 [Woeseiaceae bacterium]